MYKYTHIHIYGCNVEQVGSDQGGYVRIIVRTSASASLTV